MSEKLLIIAEKPSAAKKFASALGGMSGTFDGDEYSIIPLHGHILSNPVPDEVALAPYKETVGKFSNLEGIPWSHTWFDFNKKVPTGESDVRILRDIKGYLSNGYIPVIASDIDESGEGDLLVREVLIAVGYKGKTYREYHIDEEKKEFVKAMKNKKVVDESDPVYVMANARSNMDYLTQQLTRVATMTIQSHGYKLPAPVPMGRLKSVIVTLLGDQLKAIKAYKPSSVFESRYKLDTLTLSGKDMTQFKTKEEWDAEGLPFESGVREVKQVRGETIPPKALTLSKLAGIMAKKGMKSKQFLDTYQKMYEAGVMSYPRTEDDFISPEQFNEMLPHVDTILNLLSLPTGAFTHRTPRSTHVKTGGSHGALRPGLTIPATLDALDNQFGKFASDIYKAAGERFLMMFLENTEWVRHEYETTDTEKPFKGSVKIITKQGVVDPDEPQDDVQTKLPDLSKKATLYPHELKSKKPHATTTDWLMSELDKVNVGTGATRVGTLSNMSGNKDTFPIKESKTLDLSVMGWVGYQSAKDTLIGSVDGTKYITDLIKGIKNGSNIDESFKKFTDVINSDVNIIKNKSFDFGSLGVAKATPRITATGIWNGTNVTFNKSYMGYEFTDEQVETLLNGGEIQFEATNKEGKPVKLKGSLANQVYKGKPFVGFKGEFIRDGYVTGMWNGREVTVKGSYMDHIFTTEEMNTLFAGGSVDITTHKDNKTYELTGKLEDQAYQGKAFVGYKAVFPTREGYVKGIWKGVSITFKGSYMDHVFSTDEQQTLLSGGSINITTHKGDKEYKISGKLEKQEYQGKPFVGFKGVFANDGNASDRVTGKWKGNDVAFKGEFMKHKFTPSEIKSLLAGDTITFTGTTNAGKEMDVTGELANQTYQGRKYVGFKANFKKD